MQKIIIFIVVMLSLVLSGEGAISAQNGVVKITTQCEDVLAIKCVGRDFHLLVTNQNAVAMVDVVPWDPPYRLIKPSKGFCEVSINTVREYEVKSKVRTS